MTKRIIGLIMTAIMLFALFATALFSGRVSGNYTDNDAWFREYENVKEKSIPYYTVPTLFKNDESFKNHRRFPLVVHNNVHYVPIEMFSGLSGIKITNSYMQSFYITNESNNSYISFDVVNNLAITNLYDSYPLETKIFYQTRYIPAQHVADALGIKMEIHDDRRAGVYSLRLSDKRAKLSFGELIRMYSPIKKDQEGKEQTGEKTETQKAPASEIGPRSIYLTYNVKSFYYIPDILKTLEKNKAHATFFISPDDILENPDGIRQIIAYGQSIGFLLDPKNPTESFADAKENLRLVAKRTSRAVRFSGGSYSCTLNDNDYRDFVTERGLLVWDYNVSATDSDAMYQKVYDGLYGLAKEGARATAVLCMFPGKNTASVTNELCNLVKSKSQLNFAVHSDISEPLAYRKVKTGT